VTSGQVLLAGLHLGSLVAAAFATVENAAQFRRIILTSQ
jgi:hypothetical protein